MEKIECVILKYKICHITIMVGLGHSLGCDRHGSITKRDTKFLKILCSKFFYTIFINKLKLCLVLCFFIQIKI